MRAALFNAHWLTLGGGEQLAAGIASALAVDHDVELLVDERFDPESVSERLGADLTPFRQRVIPMGTRAFLDVTSEYDLLVNSSFSNLTASRAARSIYYVHFPVPFPTLSPMKRAYEAALDWDPLADSVERQTGFWLTEFPGHGAWTKGEARMDLVVRRNDVLPFSFRVDARPWPPGQAPHAEIVVGDERVFSGTLDTRRPLRIRTTVTGRGLADPIPVRITSDSFVPRLLLGTDDDRQLGVVVSHMRLGQPFGRLRVENVVGSADFDRQVSEVLDSYQAIAANSEYTAEWVERLWGRAATVLSPPVLMREPGSKRPIILAVGRFFPYHGGHSKKQLELVHAFRLACARGLDGWELHLVGGCKPEERGYVEDVRRAAVGLPVKFHVNAPGDDVAELFASARLFWHGSGLGEDVERHPNRLEHFGITVVEAMSAGAVPLVYERGGPAAIVRAHRCGRVYSTIEQLADSTIELVRSPDELDRLAAAAREGAHDYAFDRFSQRTRELVASLMADAPVTRG
jgi:glycosyltransferase involved in cell wall biosynthesis